MSGSVSSAEVQSRRLLRSSLVLVVCSLLAATTTAPVSATDEVEPAGTESYETDFSEYQVGEPPSGWTELWRPGDWTVLDDPRRLQLDIETAGSRRGLTPDGVGENGHVEGGVEVTTRVRGESVSAYVYYLGVHLSGEAGSENGYLLFARPPHATDPNHLRIGKYQEGTFTTLASTPLPFELDGSTWYRMRFQREGNLLRGKMWRDGVDDEPADWQVSVEDFAFDSGRVGLLHFASGTLHEWSEFTATSGGEPLAPPREGEPPERSAWVSDGKSTLAHDATTGTAIFRSCKVNTGKVPTASGPGSGHTIRGSMTADDVTYDYVLPTRGVRGSIRVKEGSAGRPEVIGGPVTAYPQHPFRGPNSWAELEADLEAALVDASPSNRVAVAVKDLSGTYGGAYLSAGHRVFDRPFRAASTIKVQILSELLRQVDCGDISLDEEIVVEEDDVVGGSGSIQDEELPQAFTVHRLAELMMTISDNTATNVLIDRIGGFGEVNALLDTQNLHETWLGRKMIHPADPTLRQENYVAVDEVVSHLDALYNERFLTSDSVELALEFMRDASGGLFADALPPDAPIARKGGSLSDIRHDVGYFLVPGREVAIAILTEGPRETGEVTAQRIARAVYDHIIDAEEGTEPEPEVFETDFLADVPGEPPNAWSELWRPGDWTVLDNPRRLRLDIETAGSRRGLTPDAVGNAGRIEGDVEVSTRVRGESASSFVYYLGLHLSGEAGSENGYVLHARPPHATDPNHVRIGRYEGGSFSTIATAPLPFELDGDTWYRMRFQREGNLLRGKMWRDGVDEEPDDWQVTVSDSIFDSGRVGVLHFASGTVHEWSEFSATWGRL